MTPTDAMQRDFARMACDANARARFGREPRRESAALADLAPRALEGYARGLLAKRYHEVRQLLPRSARAADFYERFDAYAARRPSGGADRHRADAIAFAYDLATPIARAERLGLQAREDRVFFASAVAEKRLLVWVRPFRGASLRAISIRIG